jgi:SDR family mycofactocin-dependent oxidoreductase
MTGRVAGKVAFVTGAARSQGRSHAVRLAEEGADIIAVDVCADIRGMPYPGATPADLEETVRLVETHGRRIHAAQADVRDFAALEQALQAGVAELGRLDIVCANAGVGSFPMLAQDIDDQTWQDVMDINATGVWHTCKAAIPILVKQREGGSMILTGSTAGVKATAHLAHYTAAKHAVVGIMKTLAVELGRRNIRVNIVHPTSVATPMIHNDSLYRLFAPDVDDPTEGDVAQMFAAPHLLPIPWIEPVDVSNAVLFLASDEARYVTGTELKVDAGFLTK